jgi:hypothetical protein
MKKLKNTLIACVIITITGFFANYQLDKIREENLIDDFVDKTSIKLVGNYNLDSINYGNCGLDVCYQLDLSYPEGKSFIQFLIVNNVDSWQNIDSNIYLLNYYNGRTEYSISVDKQKRNIKYNYSEI